MLLPHCHEPHWLPQQDTIDCGYEQQKIISPSSGVWEVQRTVGWLPPEESRDEEPHQQIWYLVRTYVLVHRQLPSPCVLSWCKGQGALSLSLFLLLLFIYFAF